MQNLASTINTFLKNNTCMYPAEEVGKARFNVATPGNTDLRDRYMYQACTTYVLPHNL